MITKIEQTQEKNKMEIRYFVILPKDANISNAFKDLCNNIHTYRNVIVNGLYWYSTADLGPGGGAGGGGRGRGNLHTVHTLTRRLHMRKLRRNYYKH